MNIEEVAKVLRVLSDRLDPNIPLHTALAFAEIAAEAQKDGKADMNVIGEKMKMTSAQLSRDVGILSQFRRSAEGGGLDVVTALIDLEDRRRRRLGLTRKGEKVVEELSKVKRS